MLAGDANVPSLSAAIDTDFTGVEVNARFLFPQSTLSGQVQLLASEAAAIPAEVIKTFNNGTPAEIEDSLVEFEGVQLFSVAGNLWRTDGTAEGTVRIEGIWGVREFFRFGDEIILTTRTRVLAFDPLADLRVDNPRELWVVENTGDQTSSARGISPEWFEVSIRIAGGPNRRLVSDGTKDGTFLLDPFPWSGTWTTYSLSGGLVSSNNWNELFAIQPDGTLSDLLAADIGSIRIIGQPTGGLLYFKAQGQSSDFAIWVSDGTIEGTVPLMLHAANDDLISDDVDNARVDQKFIVFSHRSGTYAFDTETGVVHPSDSSFDEFGGTIRIENYGFRLVKSFQLNESEVQQFTLQRFDYDTLQSEVVTTLYGTLPSKLLRLDDMLVFMSAGESRATIYLFDYRTNDIVNHSTIRRGNEADDVLAIAVGDGAIFVEQTDPATVIVSRIDSLRSPTGELTAGNLTSIASQYTRPHETSLFPYAGAYHDSVFDPNSLRHYGTTIDDRYFAFQAKQVNAGLYISDGTHLGTTRVSEQEAKFLKAVEGGIVFQTSDNSLWSARPGEAARLLLPADSSWSGLFDLLGVVNGRLIVSLQHKQTHIQSIWAVSTKEFTEIATSTSDHPIGYAFREVNQYRPNSQEPLVFRVDEVSPEEMRERGYQGPLSSLYRDTWLSNQTVMYYLPHREETYRRTWWVTDGTAAGTRELLAPSDLADDPFKPSAAIKGGAAWFTVRGRDYLENPSSGELRKFDGNIRSAERIENAWIILADGETHTTNDVWRWSDNEAEPQLLINHPSYISALAIAEDNLFYIVASSALRSELWRTDGTATGTQPVSAINDLQPQNIRVIDTQGNRLRLLISTGVPHDGYRKSFWMTDGTEAGTFALESDDSEDLGSALENGWTLVVGDSVVTANTRYPIRSASLELAPEAREVSLSGSPQVVSVVSENAATLTANTPLVTINVPAASSRVTLDVASLLDAPTRELKLVLSDGSVIELLNRSGEEAYYAFDPGCLTISIDGLDLQIEYVGDIRVIDRQHARETSFYSSEESETIRFAQVDGMPTVSVASGGQSASVAIPNRYSASGHNLSHGDWYFFTMGGDDEIIIDDSFSARVQARITSPITAANSASLQIGESFSNASGSGDWIVSRKRFDRYSTFFYTNNHNQAGTNPIDRFDVNFDGVVEPLDALLIINKLNKDAREQAARPSLTGFNQYADVSGDRMITAYDALMVINHLNRSRHLLQTQAIAAFASELASGKHK